MMLSARSCWTLLAARGCPAAAPSRLPAALCRRGGTSFLAQKIDEKNRLKESISTHRTGLPDKLLKLFAARPPLERLPPLKKRPPKLPYTGVSQYLEHFAAPGDAEYEPEPPATRPPEPRIMCNPELASQARVDIETKPEK